MASTAKPKTPKTIIDRVLVAIETLESPGGSSRQAIAKFLKERFDYENAPALKRALTKAVADGKLDQRGGSRDVLHVPGKQVRRQVWVDLDVRQLHGRKDKGCKLGYSRDRGRRDRGERVRGGVVVLGEPVHLRRRVHGVPGKVHERRREIKALRLRRRILRNKNRRRLELRGV